MSIANACSLRLAARLVALTLLCAPALDHAATDSATTRVLLQRYVLENPGAERLRHAQFRVYVPVRQTATQEVESATANHAYRLEVDALGNQIMIFDFDEFPGYAHQAISIRSVIRSDPGARRGRPPQVSVDLGAERYIESDAAEIRAQAAQLRREEPWQTAQALSAWVSSHLSSSRFVAADLGALVALRSGRGDCTESAYLFTALARANGIPARPLGGYIMVMGTGAELRGSAYHNWAEFYVDGRWHIADPQRGSVDPAGAYIALRIVSSHSVNSLRDAHRYFASAGLVVSVE